MTGPPAQRNPGPTEPAHAPASADATPSPLVAQQAPLLSVRHLGVAVGQQYPLLHDVSFDLMAGQRLGLIGESGSGKSLTALAILGLLPDTMRTRGSVRLQGREILGLKESRLAAIRGRQLGMVFQEPRSALDPTMKVGRQVAEVIRLHARYPTAYQLPVRDRVRQILRSVQLDEPERIAAAYPHQLSGGQRQRVALALALVNGPDLLVCDEPTTALDVTVQARVLTMLDSALRLASAACLFISHDLAVVAQVCTDVLVMLDGRVVDSGPVAQVLGQPQHPYTAGLVATARLDAVEPGARLPTLADFYPAAVSASATPS